MSRIESMFKRKIENEENIVSINVVPEVVYLVEEKDSLVLNFDFLIQGLTNKKLLIRFIKVAVYDKEDKLITFMHLNHNSIGNPSINTLGKFDLEGKKTLDIFNPFFRFSKDVPIKYLH